MDMTRPTFVCASCEAEIAHKPTFHVGLAFCCAGCVADGPCRCSYDEEVTDDHALFSAFALLETPVVAGAAAERTRAARARDARLGSDLLERLVGATG